MQKNKDGLPPEAANTIKILHACQQYRDPLLVKRYNEVEKRLEHEGKWVYTIDDNGEQINSPDEFDGRTQELVQEKLDILKKAQADFIAFLYHGHLTAWARENSPLAPWREIPASAWATIHLKNVYKGVVEGPGFLLYDVRVGPRVDIPAQQHSQPVAKLAPEPMPQPLPEKAHDASPLAPVRKPPKATTGAPGRPTNMHLVLNEFKRRCEDGLFEGKNFARESERLAEWFVEHYKEEQPIQPHSIRNSISKAWRKFPNEIRNKCIKF